MKNIELLAPAGNFETLQAAIQAGSNAVYIAGSNFGARAYATNFTNNEIKKAVSYAHLRNVKIYVTLNTIVYDNEIDELVKFTDYIYSVGVDAIIIQDLGILDILMHRYPNWEFHASTQMNTNNIEQVKYLKSIGVDRIVVAREMDKTEILEIKNNVDVEIEAFVHGSLCVAYSGQCLMSSVKGGRSGNRGACAQDCRLPWKLAVDNEIINLKNEYLLSNKDLYTINNIGEIIDHGVSSLKIEGRMKRPEYVATVVSAYREAIDSHMNNSPYEVTDNIDNEIMKSFNRGFTEGHINGLQGKQLMNTFRPNHLGVKIGIIDKIVNNRIYIKLSDRLETGDGIRVIGKNGDVGAIVDYIAVGDTKVKFASKGNIVNFNFKYFDSVYPGQEVRLTSSINQSKKLNELLNTENVQIPLDIVALGSIGQNFAIATSYNGEYIYVESDLILENAKSNPVTENSLSKQLAKMGGTPYILNNLEYQISGNVFIPTSIINDLKRQLINRIADNHRLLSDRIVLDNWVDISTQKYIDDIRLCVEVQNLEQLSVVSKFQNIDIYYRGIDSIDEAIKINNDVITVFNCVQKNIVKSPTKSMLFGELGAMHANNGIQLIADSYINVTNAYTLNMLYKSDVQIVTLSHELKMHQIRELISNYANIFGKYPNVEKVVYGRDETMVTEACPINSGVGNETKESCKLCKIGKQYTLVDHAGRHSYLQGDADCVMHIYSDYCRDEIKHMKELFDMGIRNYRMVFTVETPEIIEKMMVKFMEGLKDGNS